MNSNITFQWEPPPVRVDGRTEMTKLIGAFRAYVQARIKIRISDYCAKGMLLSHSDTSWLSL